MEESTTYTLQEIEKLKLKISGYRNTLMTLKMGTSVEDFQVMKKEFEELKMQLTYIEDLTKIMEEKQQFQNEVYEEQVKQFALQISTLNKTVEEMGQEILLISKQLMNSKDDKAINQEPEIGTDNTKSNNTLKYIQHGTSDNNVSPINNQSNIISNQPSYMQLRNLTNRVIQLQKDEDTTSIEYTEDKITQKSQSVFSPHYFQNSKNKPTFKPKGIKINTSEAVPAQITNKEKVENSKEIDDLSEESGIEINDSEKNDQSLIVEIEQGNISTFSGNIEKPNETVSFETLKEIIKDIPVIEEPTVLLERSVEEETEQLDEKSKKQWNSSFFNLFRK